MIRKFTYTCGVIACVFGAAAVADNADHLANKDTVDIQILGLQSDGGQGQIVKVSVRNDLKVSIVLRDVFPNTGNAQLERKTTVFGTTLWRDEDLLNIRPGQTVVIGEGALRLSISDKSVSSLEFYFGPKGEVLVPLK